MSPLLHRTTGPVDIRPRLLLVDDQRGLLLVLVRLLSTYRLWLAHSAEDAWRQLSVVGEPEVLVTDYDMPGNGGLWLLEQARQAYPKMGRVLMSSSDPARFAPHVASGLVQHFVYKPLISSSLRPAVDGCLAARRQLPP